MTRNRSLSIPATGLAVLLVACGGGATTTTALFNHQFFYEADNTWAYNSDCPQPGRNGFSADHANPGV